LTLARTVRMSDDLSPVEQARAARWVKYWLLKCEFVESETAQDAITALGFYIDNLDPPETVESLRAERDDARGELRYVRESFAQLSKNFEDLCCDFEQATVSIARLRSARGQDEAGRGRCPRED